MDADTPPSDWASELAAELVRTIPALRDLESLTQTAARVRESGDDVEFDMDAILPLEVVERAYVLYILDRFAGNKSHAAEALGVDPSTLYRKLHRWGV